MEIRSPAGGPLFGSPQIDLDGISPLVGAAFGLRPPLGLGEVPSSYRDYLGNLGFFWGIFRDITPIAAHQALGLGRPWFSGFKVKRRAWAEEES